MRGTRGARLARIQQLKLHLLQTFPLHGCLQEPKKKNTLGLDEDELALLETYRAMPPIEQRNMLAAFQMRLQQLKEFYANYADPTTRQK